MKMSILKTTTCFVLIIVLMMLQNLAYAADSIPYYYWNDYKEQQTKKANLENELKLAESTKLAYSILIRQLADKKKELGSTQDQIAFTDVNEKIKVKNELEKLAVLKKQVNEISSRLDTVAFIDSLGVKNFAELEQRITELKFESNAVETKLSDLKKKLVLKDSRFEKIQKIYARKLEVERQLNVLDTMRSALNDQSQRQGAVGLLGMASMITLAVKIFSIDEERFTAGSKTVWALSSAAFVFAAWTMYDSEKQINQLKKDFELKQKAYEVDYDELSEQFDAYSTVLGIN